jgi:hypothetical protein
VGDPMSLTGNATDKKFLKFGPGFWQVITKMLIWEIQMQLAHKQENSDAKQHHEYESDILNWRQCDNKI